VRQFIGVDLGGTNLRAGAVDPETGRVNAFITTPTRAAEGPEGVIAQISDLVLQVLSDGRLGGAQVGGVGVGVPGVLDLERGTTLLLPNLPGNWKGVPLRDTVARLTGLPTKIINDARSITYGEWRFGAGCGVEDMACLAIGTGIGGGLVIGGRLHLGFGGIAGELGHQIIDHDGPICGCGGRGCLEVFASGPAIAVMGQEALKEGIGTRIGQLAGNDVSRITAAIVHRAALEGDSVAKGILSRAGYYIGVALANVCVSIGPKRIVLAGGVMQAGNLLLDPIRRTLIKRVRVMPINEVGVVASTLGEYAGVIGSAMWAMDCLG